MTFGVGSPGFDLFWCPPCPDGVCNVVCLDPIDGTILIAVLVLLLFVVAQLPLIR